MEDDSFKYLGHENLGELVAELRNKMGTVTAMSDILTLEQTEEGSNKRFVQKLKPRTEESFLKGVPLILQYLEEFEQYDLNSIKKIMPE